MLRTSAPRERSLIGVAARTLGVLLLCAAGCLVTDKVEYGETNVPAHLVPKAPLNWTRVPDEPDPACGSPPTKPTDNTSWMAFQVEVSDANLEDLLEAYLVVNGRPVEDATMAKTGAAGRGTLVMCAKRGDLTEPCNRVEIVVSSDFVFGIGNDPYATEIPGDLAMWRWWILSQAGDDPGARPSDCDQQLGDGGLP